LGLVDLGALAERYPAELSGGQQQRTALARSLVIGPKVLLLDEPFASLDRDLRERMQIELRKLQQELGITMVVVTHDQHEALILSDYVAVMNHGRVEQFDGPAAVYDRPRTRFVAGFMGIPNLFLGRLERSGVEARVVLGGEALPLTERGLSAAAGCPVTVALRREEISLWPANTDPLPGQGRLIGTLRFARQIGSQIAYEVETGAGLIHVLSPRQAFRPEAGAEVALLVPAERVVVLSE
jgi:spermidine/putrescine transport system ATP-binding protein